MEKSCSDKGTMCALLAALVVCGAYVRITGLSVWYWSPDDVFHLMLAANNTVHESFRNAIQFDWVHPPLYVLILHFFLKISANEYFLRSTSLLPGIGFILLSYLAGVRAFGKAAGFFTAFIATFGFANILISEVIRPYSFMLFFLMGGIGCLLSYKQYSKRAYLYLYGLCALCALLLIYASALFIAAVGIVWFCSIAGKKRYRDLAVWFALHAVLLAVFGALFVYSIYPATLLSKNFSNAAETWLSNGYPGFSQPGLWLKNTKQIFQYFFIYNKFAVVFFFIFLVGCFYCAIRRQWEILASCLLMFGLNILCALLKKFPFTPDRHCIYLLPFVMVVTSLPIQVAADRVSRIWNKNKNMYGTAVALILVFATAFYVSENGFYRTSQASILEFPLTREEYNASLTLLMDSDAPPTVLVDTTAYYLFYDTSFNNKEELVNQWFRINYKGKTFYSFLPLALMSYPLLDVRQIGEVMFKDLPSIDGLSAMPEVRFASIGWCWNLKLGLFDMLSPLAQPKNISTASFLQSQKWFALNLHVLEHRASSLAENVNCSNGGGAMFVSIKPGRLDKHWFYN